MTNAPDWGRTSVLNGDLVLLRPTTLADVEGLAAAYDDPAIFTYFPHGAESDAPSAETVAAALASQRSTLTVVDRATGRVIGSTSLYNASPLHGRVTIGYTWYSVAVHGSGMNTESKLLLLDHVFDTWGAARAEFHVDHLNTRSRHAVLALGATEEGVLREHARRRDGRRRDTVIYSVLSHEWPALRPRLVERLEIARATIPGGDR